MHYQNNMFWKLPYLKFYPIAEMKGTEQLTDELSQYLFPIRHNRLLLL